MATTNTYLNFNGNCEEAFNFYKAAFGGEFAYLGRYSDIPADENHPLPEDEKNRIMHVSLPIGSSILMGSDSGGEWAPALVQGNNFSVSVSANSKEEADNIFNALAQGEQVTMPLANTFWCDYFGMLTDKFGINWMMSYNENPKA